MDFKKLKKTGNTLDRLAKEVDKLSNPDYGSKDERFWKPELDKSGRGYAVIRFLPGPAVDGEEALPWITTFSHGFKGPTGSWYIENSRTTIHETDPASEYNSKMWRTGLDTDKNLARDQKRRLQYISNVLVVSDEKNPQNEGKVFLFKYGKKIFDKIKNSLHPEFKDDKKVNPFDFWTGANFKLKIKLNDGKFPNYDDSSFAEPSKLFEDDDQLEKIWKSEYSLQEFLDPKNFKSYDELKERLKKVCLIDDDFEPLGNARRTTGTSKPQTIEDVVDSRPKTSPKKVENLPVEEDEEWEAFQKLASGV